MEVLLLGPLVVSADAGALAVGAQKERALLAALALRCGHVVPIGELVDALWGFDPPPTAVKTLQAYVSKLRRVLGPGVVFTERPGYVLRLPAGAVDVTRVDHLADVARLAAADGRFADATVARREALALWRGDPLPDLVDAELGRREIARLRELRHTLAEDLLESMIASGEHHRALPDLEARVVEEPLRERGWSLLMLALYRAGRQVDALRAYQAVRAILQRQVGVEPGPALRELEAAIINHDPRLSLAASVPLLAPVSPPPTTARAPVTASASIAATKAMPDERSPSLPSSLSWVLQSAFPFAGRDPELAAVRAAWDDAGADRQRRAILIGGEPGIGKTRLIGEAAVELHRLGAVVLFGRCDEGLGAPYQPFVEALSAFAGACPPHDLRDLVGPLGGELTRLLPDLRVHLDGLDAPIAADADTERHRLFEAVSEMLERISTRQPVCLVLDDLQWATTPTLLLLRHLLVTTRPARLLIAGTYRSTELDRVHPLAGVLADLRRHEHARRLSLDGLDEQAAIDLAATAADHELDEGGVALIRRLHRECDGNPFFFWTMLTHLVETGLIVRRDGRWTHTEEAFATALPEGIREVVARRLSAAGDETNQVLRVAALVGSAFDHRVVAHAAGVDEERVLDALDLARQSGVVTEVHDHYGRFVFTHDLLRRSLVEEVSTTRRARLHWRILEVLLDHYGADDEDHLDELARHAEQGALAGDQRRAVDILRRAGDVALAALAFEEAAAHYDDALGFVDADDDDVDTIARRYALLLARGRALQRSGNSAHREVLLDAVAHARRLGDADRLAEAVLALHHTAYLNISAAADPDLRALFQEAIDTLDACEPSGGDDAHESGDPDRLGARARLSSGLALTRSLSDQRARAIVLSTDAVRLARLSGDPRVLAQVLSDHSWVITGPDTVTERIALGDEAVALAHELGDHVGLVNGYNTLTTAWLELGDLERGAQALELGHEQARFLRRPTISWGFDVFRGALATLQGDVATLDTLADTLPAAGREAGVDPTTLLAVQARLLFAARYEQGRLGELDEALTTMVEQPSDVDWTAVLAVAHVEAGRLAEAHAIVARPHHLPRNRDLTWLPLRMLTTMALAGVRDEALSSALYDELLPFAGRNSHDGAGTCGPVDLGLGRLAAVLGRWEDATRHFENAAGRCRAWRAPMWSAHVALEHAEMLVRRGTADLDLAALLLRCALDLSLATGQDRVRTRASAQLDQLTVTR